MLTGDKLETAENVGKSCELINPEMSVMRFSSSDLQECKKYMDECIDIYKLCVAHNRKKALLIEGDALNILTGHHDLREKFIHISKNCEAVICCRVTPKQKADVVRLIKGHLNKVTLAVGDGANDVNMLQEADIGIGIYGQEGLRAVQASDFAIGEFQCLWKLLLVHGRWNYIRISEMILYFFYKNMVMTLPQFYFSFFCGFSGQTVFDDWYITLYNMVFTCFPLLIKAIFDQDLDYREVLSLPDQKKRIFPKSQRNPNEKVKERPFIRKFYHRLYYIGQGNCIFNVWSFVTWIFSAILHSLIIFFASFIVFHTSILNFDGLNSDMWAFSITAFTIIVLIVTARLGLTTKNWTLLFLFALSFLSVLLYLSYIFVSDTFKELLVYRSVAMTFSVMASFALIFGVVGLAFALDLVAMVLSQEVSSSLVSYFRILIKTGQEGDQQYYEELLNEQSPINRHGVVHFGRKSKIPRPSIFFEALDKRIREDGNRKQFHFINVVNVKSGEVGSLQQCEADKINEGNEEEEIVISEDVCIKRKSTIKSVEKVIVG